MMMAHDPKKLAVSIIASKSPSTYSDAKKANEGFDPKADPKLVEEMSEESQPELEAAAEEFLSAVEMKDPKAIASAFQAMMEICDSYESEPSEGASE